MKNFMLKSISLTAVAALMLFTFMDFDSPWSYWIWLIAFLWLCLFGYVNWDYLNRERCDVCGKKNSHMYETVRGTMICAKCIDRIINEVSEEEGIPADVQKMYVLEGEYLRRI